MTNEDSTSSRKMRTTVGDLTAVGIVVMCMLFLLYETFQMTPSVLLGYPGDAFFPQLIIAVILLCGVSLLITRSRDHFKRRGDADKEIGETFSFDVRGFLIVGALSLSFPLLLPHIGFEIITFVMLTVLFATRFEEYITAETITKDIVQRITIKASIIAFITMVLLYFIFVVLLGVAMPVNFFPKYISFDF